MIKKITVASLLSLLLVLHSAIAQKVVPTAYPEMGRSFSQIIIHERSMFSGLVLKTDEGIAITTNRGTFLLRGADLEELVGKNVLVTGVMRGGAIFAVKIDVVQL